jgi:hypothetical protein
VDTHGNPSGWHCQEDGANKLNPGTILALGPVSPTRGGGGMLSAQDQQEPELRTYPCCVSPLRGVDWCCDLDLGASRCCCTDVQLKALTHLGQQGRAA